ncbi:LysR family transcriptional regulator (plasmid) [Phyllobacterium sp. 628]|uniref:LysR family transcriptional regulator n=1 Tax=Phyllobacterium sp. 628 TaxID=2718938 RepID=UPI0016628C22|nr:LysR family transcriptional regulator [Phyllobacterium sp. 628]QND50672.1 LysR family transcriptional regulator [Phyllobacterium sp. 628]
MSRNLDIDLLRTFMAVADHGSMTAAANARYLTQSAVSQQIRRFEDMLGSALFERDRRGLRLTPPGELLLTKARRLLALNDDIWSEMTADALQGKVRLGLPYDLVSIITVPVLKAYAEAYPLVEVSLVCASSPELMTALERREVDLALVEEEVVSSQAEYSRVEQLVWVGARNGGAHLKTPLPVSMVAETCAFRPAVLSSLDHQARPWRTVFENGNIEATMAMVRADLAITILLASTVPADLDVLTSGDGLPALPQFAIGLHMPKGDVAPSISEMAKYIRVVLGG